MCVDCGCSTPVGEGAHTHEHGEGHHHDHPRTLSVEQDILATNNRLADLNRALFADHGIFVVNLVSSPGSGKTTLLERTLRELSGELSFAVLEGDQQTSNDADRIAATGVPVHQINTGAGCHLDAHMVAHGVENFDLSSLDCLFIENVGNLVCPASFDLGEAHKVVVLSVTEGEDKPLKYPHMFQAADLAVINKVDLLPYVPFDIEVSETYARQVNPELDVMRLSSLDGSGLEAWYGWLKRGIEEARSAS